VAAFSFAIPAPFDLATQNLILKMYNENLTPLIVDNKLAADTLSSCLLHDCPN
jgi:hypothetical protein